MSRVPVPDVQEAFLGNCFDRGCEFGGTLNIGGRDRGLKAGGSVALQAEYCNELQFWCRAGLRLSQHNLSIIIYQLLSIITN